MTDLEAHIYRESSHTDTQNKRSFSLVAPNLYPKESWEFWDWTWKTLIRTPFLYIDINKWHTSTHTCAHTQENIYNIYICMHKLKYSAYDRKLCKTYPSKSVSFEGLLQFSPVLSIFLLKAVILFLFTVE